MLSFLILASTTGRALPADVIGSLERVPRGALTHEPETSTVWITHGGRVAVAAWQTGADLLSGRQWHVGGHGLTLFSGSPWPTHDAWTGGSPIAQQLTDRIGEDPPIRILQRLAGTFALARIRPDGTGWVTADLTGAGPVHHLDHEGYVAISNRASLAAGRARPRRSQAAAAGLPFLGTMLGDLGPLEGGRVLRPGQHLRLTPDAVLLDTDPTGWWDDGDREELIKRAAAAITHQVEAAALAAEAPVTMCLSGGPGGRLLLAAATATDTLHRFRVVTPNAAGSPGTTWLRDLAAALGIDIETVAPPLEGSATHVHRWAQGVTFRTEAGMAGNLAALPQLGEMVVCDGYGRLWIEPGSAPPVNPDPFGILAAEHRERLTAWWAELESDRRRGVASRVLLDLEHRLPRTAAGRSAALAPTFRIRPLQSLPAIAAALWSHRGDPALLDDLVSSLDPGLADAEPAPRIVGGPIVTDRWERLAPLLEAELVADPAPDAAGLLDLDRVRTALRSADPPTESELATLWGALTATIWLSAGERHDPVPRRIPHVTDRVVTPARPPVLVSGLTSSSILDLAGIRLPLDEIGADALLGIKVDEAVADLVQRLLLACDASTAELPADLGDRLARPEMAAFAPAAQALLARRGGILADPRIGLTLPFWREHVAEPQVVLVAERPAEMVSRIASPLPRRQILTTWLDVVVATLTAADDVRLLDPQDIADLDLPEGTAEVQIPDAAVPGSDDELLLLAGMVDSLIRELEVDAVRPLLRAVRPGTRPDPGVHGAPPRPPTPAGLEAIADLREHAQRLRGDRDAAKDRMAALEAELEQLRARRAVRMALRMSRALGRS